MATLQKKSKTDTAPKPKKKTKKSVPVTEDHKQRFEQLLDDAVLGVKSK
ncbi:MAG: hypothetical protein KIT18_05200 [Burkholderiales bacterium]|nr:hypothetical protein [Burkholderiales bacterium]